jgi:DnaJ-class molecular chaperone
MTPSLRTAVEKHLAYLAGQDAMPERDAEIRALLSEPRCPTCRGMGNLTPGYRTAACPDCSGVGKITQTTIAKAISDASPDGRGLSRERVRQIGTEER